MTYRWSNSRENIIPGYVTDIDLDSEINWRSKRASTSLKKVLKNTSIT